MVSSPDGDGYLPLNNFTVDLLCGEATPEAVPRILSQRLRVGERKTDSGLRNLGMSMPFVLYSTLDAARCYGLDYTQPIHVGEWTILSGEAEGIRPIGVVDVDAGPTWRDGQVTADVFVPREVLSAEDVASLQSGVETSAALVGEGTGTLRMERKPLAMPSRTCDACGKDKDVSGGKTCETGHFVCSSCVYGGILGPTRSSCPLCSKPLR